MAGFYDAVYAVVRAIPAGRVATYGQVARLAGRPRGARQVGYALAALETRDPRPDRVPWHRVVNACGGISMRARPGAEEVQRLLLEAEGVVFDGAGRVSLERFAWHAARTGLRPP